ncbi:MAG: delta-60 repeat domain-containing protein, partial [Calditrichaeota bacterium]|nr:delta-60 repeat domain-containing protein [Calditrichota bacterium]
MLKAIERTVELTVTDIALAVGEKIILAGKVQMRGGANRMLLARFTRSGNPDLSFDGKGYLLSNLDGAADLEPRSVIADPFGNILVGGWALFEAPPSESPPQDAPADTSD